MIFLEIFSILIWEHWIMWRLSQSSKQILKIVNDEIRGHSFAAEMGKILDFIESIHCDIYFRKMTVIFLYLLKAIDAYFLQKVIFFLDLSI